MSRLQFFANHPRRVLAALATVVAAAGVAVGSGANFTSSTSTAANTFASGTLHVTSNLSTTFASGDMRPGDTKTGIVTIHNDGSLSGNYTLSKSISNQVTPAGKSPLADVLKVQVDEVTDATGATVDQNIVPAGLLASMADTDVGGFTANQTRFFKFTITFPDGGSGGADNAYQGTSLDAGFDWNGVS